MAWLLKTEPSTYSFGDLQHDASAVWDGVSNPAALKNMRSMKAGDKVLIYHTGDEKAVVGIAKVTRAAYPDPKEKDAKLVVIEIAPVKALVRPVTLAEIKGDRRLKEWNLVRIGRLSVVPTSEEEWRTVMELGGTKG